MKKIAILLLVLNVSVQVSRAQHYEHSYSLLAFDNESGWFFGPTFQYELQQYSIGGEVKTYDVLDFLYPNVLFSYSKYANFRRHISQTNPSLPNNTIGLGAHLSFFSLETNYSFGNDRYLWDFTPKLILDFGCLNVSYGYKIPVTYNVDLAQSHQHTLSLKYYLTIRRSMYWVPESEE